MTVFPKSTRVQFDPAEFADCLGDRVFASVVLMLDLLSGPVAQRAWGLIQLEEACSRMRSIADRYIRALRTSGLIVDGRFVCDLTVNSPAIPENGIAFRLFLKADPTPDTLTLPHSLLLTYTEDDGFWLSWWK